MTKLLRRKDPKCLALAKADTLKLFYLNPDAGLIARIALHTFDVKLFEDVAKKYLLSLDLTRRET